MILLLMLPVIFSVAAVHRYLAVYAPTNVLVRSVRRQEPRWRTVLTLAALAISLLVAMHLVAEAVITGAPGWLNLVVLVLTWDSIKVGWLAVSVVLRAIARRVARSVGRASWLPQPSS